MNQGFTLIELLVALTLLSLLLMFSIPSWQDARAASQRSAEANHLLRLVALARSEAIIRNVPVSLCKSADRKTCSGAWSQGQIIFIDKDQKGRVVSPRDILYAFDPLVQSGVLEWHGMRSESYLTFLPAGTLWSHNGKFTYCPQKKGAACASVIVNIAGRARMEKSYCHPEERSDEGFVCSALLKEVLRLRFAELHYARDDSATLFC